MNKEVTQYIELAPPEQKLVMEEVRKLIHASVPGVQENIKWGRPVFSAKKDFAYFKTAKAYVSIGFMRSQLLKDDMHLLEGTGTDMRHIKVKKPSEIDAKRLAKWFKLMAE